MTVDPRAGKPPEPSMLANIPRLVSAYYTQHPDPSRREERVAFGTSGHRGSSLNAAFTESHILAITQAICQYRREQSIDGPVFLGIDTHALSESAFGSALEVLAANGVDVMIDSRDGYTPTPALSHAILTYNRGRTTGLADGIVVTPSHNPPEDGGFKYNGTNGGPADTKATGWIEQRANADPRRRPARREAHPARARARRGHDASLSTTPTPTSPICRPCSTSMSFAARSSGSASIHSAAPASRTGG